MKQVNLWSGKQKLSSYFQRFLLSSIILSTIAVLAAGCSAEAESPEGMPFYNTPDFTPRWIGEGEAAYKDIHTVAPFVFMDQNGETITEKDFRGKIYIADFIFTSCPSICPVMTRHMAQVQEKFRDDPDIKFISHSVTPERDSVSVLRQYATDNGVIDGKWHVVTGDREEIYTLARRSYFADKDIGFKKGPDDFLHTDNFILVDQQRRIRGVYSGTMPDEMGRLIEDIMTLKSEGENRNAKIN